MNNGNCWSIDFNGRVFSALRIEYDEIACYSFPSWFLAVRYGIRVHMNGAVDAKCTPDYLQ